MEIPIFYKGANNMEKPTVELCLARYTELVQKEVIYDELMKEKEIHMYLTGKEVKNVKSSGFNGALNK